MPTYSDYLIEGARKLSTVEFGFSVRENKWDRRYWKENHKRYAGGAKGLRLKPGVSATVAVTAIFNKIGDLGGPDAWSFDCSQFCQVVNFYAQMKTLNKGDTSSFYRFKGLHKPASFDTQIIASGKPLEIRPFHGAYFTVREHYYRRESQTEWMKYRANQSDPLEETRIPAWDLVRAAPVGTRVNFNVGEGGDWDYENTVKANMNPLQFTAHGLEAETPQGLVKKVWNHDELLIELAKKKG